MATVNPALLKMALQTLEKSAVVPSDAAMMAGGAGAPPGGAPPGGAPPGGAPPMDPAAMGAAPPVDPSAMGGAAPPPPGADPTGAATMAAPPMAAPPPAAPPAAPGAAGPMQQKLKPEQMMQMIDFRMYNMQQQLTAIMNAMGVQVDPATLVLPPGTQGAPPAESALPGGPMAPPPQQDPNAAAGPTPPGGPLPPGGPMDPSQPPPDPNAGKQANWWEKPLAKFAAQTAQQPVSLQDLAAAAKIILRNL